MCLNTGLSPNSCCAHEQNIIPTNTRTFFFFFFSFLHMAISAGYMPNWQILIPVQLVEAA